MRGKRTHVDVGIESPHERLIPRVLNHTRSTQMVNDVCQILGPVFHFPRPELGVEIRSRECRNDGGYMRDSGDIEDDDDLERALVSCLESKRVEQFLRLRLDYHLVRRSPRV